MRYITVFLLISLYLFAQENQIFLTEEEKAFIKNNPHIKLGIDATWVPYVIVKDGKVVGGYEYDMIKKINKLANMNIELIPGIWDDVVKKAKSAQIHGLATSVASKERAKYFEFTNTNVIVRNNFLVKEGNPRNIKSLKDLKNKVVAIQKNNGFQRHRVKNIKGAKIVEFKDYSDFSKFLEKNDVDAIPMSEASLYTVNTLNTKFNKVLYLEDSGQTQIVFSINKKYPKLTSIINKALAYIPLDEINELRKKWLFSPIIYKEQLQKPIKLTEKEKLFLKNKPRIIIGIETKISVQKGDTNKFTEDVANQIYELSGLRIDFKIAPKQTLLHDIKTKKIEGFISNQKFCQANADLACSTSYFHNKFSSYNFAIQKHNEEVLSIIEKSLQRINTSKIDTLSFLNQKEKEYLFKNNTIRFCANPSFAPFEQIKDDNYVGIGADTLILLSNLLKSSFQFIKTDSWAQSLEFMKEKKCDILPLVAKTQARFEYMNFTTPVYEYNLVIVTKNNISFINKIEDLKDRKIGISQNYATNEIIKNKYPFLDIVSVKDNKEGLEKVKNGKIFALLGAVPSLGNLIQEQYLGELKISGNIKDKWFFSIGVEKEKTLLLDILNKALEEIPQSRRQNIMNKWSSFVYEDNLEYVIILKVVIVILCFIFLILILFVYRQYLLNKLNTNLKQAVEAERKKNKEQMSYLLHQSKLAQIGEMTNIIAHQWRQPLSAISATTNNLVFKLTLEENIDKEEFINEIELISTYSQHLSKTINDFRYFFKSDKKLVTVKVDEIIEKAVQIIQPILKKNNISLEIQQDVTISLKTYKNEIQQALLSIIQNAKDAIIENQIQNGKIIIKTNQTPDYINIEICDNGGGIDDGVIEKIFDSCFTTKNKSGGTGIGLYISKIIIESHCKGKLSAKNQTNGASFTISLPPK